jgi:hypothetical protein
VAEAMRGQLKIYRQWSQQIQHGERQWRKWRLWIAEDEKLWP